MTARSPDHQAASSAPAQDRAARGHAGAPESDARFRQLVETLSQVIFQADATGRWTFLNPAWSELTGFPVAESLGTSLLDFVHADDADQSAQVFNRLIRAGAQTTRFECRFRRKDGTHRWTEVRARALLDAGGQVVGAVGAVIDVSERKHLESLKDEFIATVSHELRTPLTAIRGHLELLLDEDAGPINDQQRRFLTVASQSTDRLVALINDLLDTEKLRSGRVRLQKAAVDLGRMLREVAATHRVEAERKGLALTEEVTGLPPVMGDRERLIQVFSNLVTNAIKYTEQGEVGIQARATYGHVEVVVHDTGIGMSEDDQRQLYTRFYRGEAALVRRQQGTGLGLVIAKGLIDAHGGTISVESHLGRGTRFRVVLPALAPEAGAARRPADGPATVLVVDDEITILDLTLEYLELWGYRGVGARGGDEGLKLVRQLQPALVILDVMMPNPDGLEVLRRLKADPALRHIPVILYSVEDQRERFLQLGATDSLLKPVLSARLQEAIVAALHPVPVHVVSAEPNLAERLGAELRGTGVEVQWASTLTQARAIQPAEPCVVLVSRALADGSSDSLVEHWSTAPAFAGTVVVLVGDWPGAAAFSDRPPSARVERAAGRRASDLAAQVRARVHQLRGQS